MKAVLLARVSTEEQEAYGHSLPAQVERLRTYAAKHGIEIVEEFVYSESAGPKIRKKFEAMLSYLRRNKTVRTLLCMNVDRLTRNFRDQVDLDEMRRHDRLEIHFVQEGFVLNGNSGGTELFMWEAKVFIAKQYINRLSDDAKRSVSYKLGKGEWIARAPLGYLNQRDKDGRGTIIMDSDRAFLMKRIFEEYSTGLRSIEELTSMAYDWGLRTRAGRRLPKSSLFGLLQNPFYCGDMVMKENVYPHCYPVLISRALFARCQEVRLGKSFKRAVESEKPFIFRGAVTCATTGQLVSSDLKKGKYTYLICADPANPSKKMWVPERLVLEQVQKAIARLHIPENVLEELVVEMRRLFDSQKAFHREHTGAIKRQLTLLQEKLNKLTDLLLDDIVTPEEHTAKRNAFIREREELKIRLHGYEQGDDAFINSLEALLALCSKAPRIFGSSREDTKREIINFVLSNLKLEGATLCYTFRSPFEVFANIANVQYGDPCRTSLELFNAINDNLALKLVIINTFIPPALRFAA